MILSDADIKGMMKDGEMDIENFTEKNLTPNGYDLTIEEIYIFSTKETVKEGIAEIPPKTGFAVSTREFVKCPPNLAATLWIRTTWARKGVIASFGMIDAGFHGTLTLAAYNASDEAVKIDIGNRFAQMVFHLLRGGAEKTYDRRSGNYQGQRGVTLEGRSVSSDGSVKKV